MQNFIEIFSASLNSTLKEMVAAELAEQLAALREDVSVTKTLVGELRDEISRVEDETMHEDAMERYLENYMDNYDLEEQVRGAVRDIFSNI